VSLNGTHRIGPFRPAGELAETIPGRPALVFDGDCRFCTAAVEWLLERAREPIRPVPYQRAGIERLGVSREEARRELLWVEPGGEVLRGHRAVTRALRACDRPWSRLATVLRYAPGRWLAGAGYRLVARYRGRLPGTTPACAHHWRYAE
jgi:predicted DCC family thiol-disulfide oxidoreductase YuxK